MSVVHVYTTEYVCTYHRKIANCRKIVQRSVADRNASDLNRGVCNAEEMLENVGLRRSRSVTRFDTNVSAYNVCSSIAFTGEEQRTFSKSREDLHEIREESKLTAVHRVSYLVSEMKLAHTKSSPI